MNSGEALPSMRSQLLPPILYSRCCMSHATATNGRICRVALSRPMHPLGIHPLRLLSQTPMALSSTGPRSLAVAPCGRHLLVSASTGGAWNAFSLGDDGVPDSIAIPRKETGHATSLRTVVVANSARSDLLATWALRGGHRSRQPAYDPFAAVPHWNRSAHTLRDNKRSSSPSARMDSRWQIHHCSERADGVALRL